MQNCFGVLLSCAMAAEGFLKASWSAGRAQDRFFYPFGGSWGATRGQHGRNLGPKGASCGPQEANMAATWASRWSPNRTKIDAKINTKNRCVLDFHFWCMFRILGRKMRPSWHQNGSPNRYCRESEKPKNNLAR